MISCLKRANWPQLQPGKLFILLIITFVVTAAFSSFFDYLAFNFNTFFFIFWMLSILIGYLVMVGLCAIRANTIGHHPLFFVILGLMPVAYMVLNMSGVKPSTIGPLLYSIFIMIFYFWCFLMDPKKSKPPPKLKANWPKISWLQFTGYFFLNIFSVFSFLLFYKIIAASLPENIFWFLVSFSIMIGYFLMLALCALRANSIRHSPYNIVFLGLVIAAIIILYPAPDPEILKATGSIFGFGMTLYILFLMLPIAVKKINDAPDETKEVPSLA
ncbi:MAG: hypothetical protein ACQEQL_03020 [Pseudomonadota bacterium]